MKKNIKNRGFMVIEVLVASSIITVSILAAMAVAQKSVYVSRQAFHVSQAAFLLEEGAENARVNRDNATKDIVTSGGTSDAGTKLITVTVSWKEGGTTVTKTLQFYLTDVFS